MKRLYHFVPMLVLSLFAVIFLILAEACIFVDNVFLDSDFYMQAMNEKNVTDSMYDELCTYFDSLSHATGIPTEVFTDPLDKEELYTSSFKLLQESINYLKDKNSPKPAINYDYSKVEKSITDYISKHAEENNIEKNEEYQKLVDNTVNTAKKQIESRFDVMMLYTLSKTSGAEKLHNYSWLFGIGSNVFIGLTVIMLVIMVIIDRHHPRDFPYWGGLLLAVTGCFWLVPSVILKSTDFFSTFAIRNEYIYNSVTGMFNLALDKIMRVQIILAIIGFVLIISTLVIHIVYLHYLKTQYRKNHGND